MTVYQLGIFSSWLDPYCNFDLRSWRIFAHPTMNTKSITETSGAVEQTTPKRKSAAKSKPAKQTAKAKTRTKKNAKGRGTEIKA
jgi:hypothetical protein